MFLIKKISKNIELYCLITITIISFAGQVSAEQNQLDSGRNLAYSKSYTCNDKNTYGWNSGLTDGSWENKRGKCFATKSTDKFPKHVTINLQGTVKLDKVELGVPPFGSTKTVDIEVSTDGQTFKKVGGVVFQQKKVERKMVNFPIIEASYLRLTFQDHYKKRVRYNTNTMFLSEVQAFGKDFVPSQNELYTGKEFHNAFVNPKDNPKIPNVLLIGDSISIGYTVDVRKLLKGKADIFRIPTNGRHTSYGLKKISGWLKGRKWDVIHFNWGLWDICYRNPKPNNRFFRDKLHGKITTNPEQYKENMEQIVNQLKATDAKLIWCSTTPVPKNETGRIKGDEVKYNQIATEIMKNNNIQIDDLYSFAELKISDIQKRGDVHFTANGYAYLAKKVAKEISHLLDKKNDL